MFGVVTTSSDCLINSRSVAPKEAFGNSHRYTLRFHQRQEFERILIPDYLIAIRFGRFLVVLKS